MTIRNFSNINEEAPIFSLIKPSHLIFGWGLAIFPLIFAYIYSSIILTIIWIILAIVGWFIADYKKDWRWLISYLGDKNQTKYKIDIRKTKDRNINVKKYDISWLIESLKK